MLDSEMERCCDERAAKWCAGRAGSALALARAEHKSWIHARWLQDFVILVESPMDIQTDSEGNPILDQHSEEGFVDLTFRVSDLVDEGEHYRFHLAASHKKRSVGMDVVLVKGIQGGFDAKMNLVKQHVYRLGVRFLRSGAESDRLISAIGDLYGSKISPKKMVDEETFTAIALQQGALDVERESVGLKIFGKDGEPFDQDAYYESFFNVDLPNGFVHWNEKDPGYREPLLRALSAQ
jgi:hypothetical protein